MNLNFKIHSQFYFFTAIVHNEIVFYFFQYVCHMKCNLHYSPKKMWYIAILVRGMSVDEAVKQLSFVPRKGAVMVKEAILEAQNLAVEEHNVEFKSNLWVGKCTTVIIG